MVKICVGIILLMAAMTMAESPALVRVDFETEYSTNFGQSVFVLGSLPELGGNDPAHAVKMSPYDFPKWRLAVELPTGASFTYRFFLGRDGPDHVARSSSLIRWLTPEPLTLRVPGQLAPKRTARVCFFSQAPAPQLEYYFPISGWIPIWTEKIEEGVWQAQFDDMPGRGEWTFRIRESEGQFLATRFSRAEHFTTGLSDLWVSDGQVFSERPEPAPSDSRVIKIDPFPGVEGIAGRPLYLYLPRGFDESVDRRYPVIYMHDGQNVFEAFVKDSFAGSWRADEVADRLIGEGRMPECLIVGVANGGSERMWEYLPPDCTRGEGGGQKRPGRADQLAAYYRGQVAPYIEQHYRGLSGREHRATVGSSMGGLLSAYMAWNLPDFAGQHAALSSSFWITGERNVPRSAKMIEQLRTGEPRDMRLWLDSGTRSGDSDDGMGAAFEALDALLENGYAIGPNLQHHVDAGAGHNERAWARRLDRVFLFLFPIAPETHVWASGGRIAVDAE